MSRELCDPSWKEFCASRRRNTLYVKMPLTKAQAVVTSMGLASFLTGDVSDSSPTDALLEFLREQLRAARNQALFYAIPVDEARQDIEALILVEPQDRTGILQRFRLALEAGLRDDPRVDWIYRMGGPKPTNGLTSSGSLGPILSDEDVSML